MKRIAYTGLLVGLLAGTTAAQSESVWDQDFADSYRRTGRAVDDFAPSGTPTAGRAHFPKFGGVFQKIKERRKNSKSGTGVVLEDAVPTEDALGPGATPIQETAGVGAAQGDSVEPAELPPAAPTDPWATRESVEPYSHSRRGFRMPSLHVIPRGRFVTIGRFFPRSGGAMDDDGVGSRVTMHNVVPADNEG